MRIVGFKRVGCALAALALPATIIPRASAQCELVKLEAEPYRSSMGTSVAIQGHRVVSGAPLDNSDEGAVYVFRREGPQRWVREARLVARDPSFQAQVGWSVAIDSDTIVAGAPGHAFAPTATYVFRRRAGRWQQEAKLTIAGEDTEFGYAVGISGNRCVVGAWLDDDGLGSAYVFRRDPSGWVQETKLTASDRQRSLFGIEVTIDGDRVVVGDPSAQQGQGAAYVFRRDGTTWRQEARLTASDGQASDNLGTVSISGDRIVLGARGHSGFEQNAGAAYVFRRDGADWIEEAKLTASDAVRDAFFGQGVAIDADQLVIGAWNDKWLGAAYVFKLDGGAWAEQSKLTASDGQRSDQFGIRVALNGNRVVAGAPHYPNGGPSASYLFAVSGDANGNGIVDECELGDLNCDGRMDALDIEPFILALFDPAEYEVQYPDCDINLADINDDGLVDAADIEGFIELLFAS